MIGKIKSNHSFAETTGYVLNKEKARLLGGTLAGTDSAIISREFLLSRDINPGIKRPVYHLMQSYSYSDRDTQNLTDDKLLELATKHFAGMVLTAKEPELLKKEGLSTYRRRVDEFIETELSGYQFFVARHEDVEHTHTHLVASRINVRDGLCIPTYLERHRNQLICRELEKDFDLERVPNSWEVDTRKPNRGWSKGTKARDTVEVQTQLQTEIDQVTQSAKTMTFEEFSERLLAKGVEVRRTQHEHQIGLSYKMNGTAVKASKLGKRYTYPGLQAQGVDDAIQRHTIQQTHYTNRIAPQVTALWNREALNRPSLTEVTFDDYQVRLSDTGQPEVFKGDLKLLEANEAGYQSYSLTETDCEAVQRMDTLSQTQAQERRQDELNHQAQRQSTEQLVRRVHKIWTREKAGRPNLTVVPFDNYRIQAVGGQIHLYKNDIKLLEVNGTGYQSYSLAQTDCDAIQRFNSLSQAQAKERKTIAPDVMAQQMEAQDHYDRLATLVRAEAGQHLSIAEVDKGINAKIRAVNPPNVDQLVFATILQSPETQRLKYEQGREVAETYVRSIVGQPTPVKTPPKPVKGGEGR